MTIDNLSDIDIFLAQDGVLFPLAQVASILDMIVYCLMFCVYMVRVLTKKYVKTLIIIKMLHVHLPHPLLYVLQ